MISHPQEVVPQLWLAKLSAVMPGTGLPITWHGLWMEEARGITLYGLQTSGGLALSLSLLQQKLNRTQVPAPCTSAPASLSVVVYARLLCLCGGAQPRLSMLCGRTAGAWCGPLRLPRLCGGASC